MVTFKNKTDIPITEGAKQYLKSCIRDNLQLLVTNITLFKDTTGMPANVRDVRRAMRLQSSPIIETADITNRRTWIQYVLGKRKTGIKELDQRHTLNYEILATVIEQRYDDLDRHVLIKCLADKLKETEDRIKESLEEIDSLGGFYAVFGALPVSSQQLDILDELMDSYVFESINPDLAELTSSARLS